MSGGNNRVFITSYSNVEGRGVAAKLKYLYEHSDKRHIIVEDPESADVILIGGIGNEINKFDYLNDVVNQETIGQYADKCFSVSYRDEPIIFNRGVYESGVKSALSLGRVMTGSYALSGSFNSYIARHEASESDYDQKEYLLSFIGRDSHQCRRKILSLEFKRKDVFIQDSSNFSLWRCNDEIEKDRRERHYFETLLRSKFSLCPRGTGAGSIRLFESMKLGVAPIIVSDGWILPRGPDWRAFSILVKEGGLGQLESRIVSQEENYKKMGELARQSYQEYFAKEVYFNYVVDGCREMGRRQIIPERNYWQMRHLISYAAKARRSISRLARQVVGA